MEPIIINNIDCYNVEIKDNKLIIIPKKLKQDYISIDDIYKYDLTHSKILKCEIKNNKNNIISTKTRYFKILCDIYSNMSTSLILQNTLFNIKLTNEKGINGYYWNDRLKLSIQHKDSNNTMKEILNMIKLNKYFIKITIKLNTEEILNCKN